MGKKSIKEKKNIYQQMREELGLTRAQASELLETISENQLVKFENGTTKPHDDDILIMSEKYKKPELCNYYCSKECMIGKRLVPAIKLTNLAQITMGLLASSNKILDFRDRLIEITADGKVTNEESEDFYKIQEILNKMAVSISEMQLWVESTKANGEL